MSKKIYTVIEAAKKLSISNNMIYQLIKEKKLKAIKVGSIKILESDLLKYINDNN